MPMEKRKLTAIMFTDIQGYTAIMHHSEQDALVIRNRHRMVFEQVTERFNGKILQYYGDGTLSVFESAVDAVRCGMEMQFLFQREPRVPVRVGIHLGDIIHTETDIIGDGVNLAARIESLAVAGSVFISDKVHDEVRNAENIQSRFLRKFKLKNVEEPMGVYAVSNPGLVVPSIEEIKGKIEEGPSLWKSAKRWIGLSLIAALVITLVGFWGGSLWTNYLLNRPNIKVAVLPFENTSPYGLNEYPLSDMTGELIEELSKIDKLTVLSRSTSQVLAAGVGLPDKLIENQLDRIDFFIRGSVKQEDNHLIANLTLSKKEDQPRWSKNYITEISGARKLWHQIAVEIAKEMGLNRSSKEMAKRANLKPVDPVSYRLYLEAKRQFDHLSPEAFQKGIALLEDALDKNPTDAHAYAHLAEGYVQIGHFANTTPDVFPKALSAARRAIQLDSTVAMGWAALAHYHTYFGMDWDLAEYAFQRANELDPNMAYNHYHRAWYHTLFGRMTEAIEEHKKAQELEPFDPVHTAWLGELYRMVGLYDKALVEVEKASQMVNGYVLSPFVKGRIYIDQGKAEEGLEILRASEWRYLGYLPALLKLGRVEEARVLIQEVEDLEINPWWALCLGINYALLGDSDTAFKWLNYKPRDAWFPWIRVMWFPDEMREDPRFLKLMEDINLPPPTPLQFD